ncbi:MAG: deoxyribonuclease IV [Ruminococcaceae bacterium]|nr:deoxyribonuclease IV [Oscillospiraceae bacterium]
MKLNLGCHLSVSKGYEHMGKEALSIGANTFQFFTRNPRGGSFKPPTDEDVNALVELMKENNFAPIIAHAPYTFNPCAADEGIRDYTKRVMAEDVRLLDRIPGALYNFHPGCHVSQGVDIGIEKTADTLNTILAESEKTTVLIETMAGKGTEIGKTFEEIQKIIEKVELSTRVGVCLDTCHVHDGGYNISEDVFGVLDEFDSIIGLDRLKAIHLNDSKNVLGAHKDRHEKIGGGNLSLDGIIKIITHPVVKNLPICLETPNDIEGYAREIKLLSEAVYKL